MKRDIQEKEHTMNQLKLIVSNEHQDLKQRSVELKRF